MSGSEQFKPATDLRDSALPQCDVAALMDG
jgi:hypothetical protein